MDVPARGFALPVGLAFLAISTAIAVGFTVQFAGLVAERWCFFAQARHPQSLTYQFIS